MEQHPVPRNITGFQFRLIGDMTLKQFGYLLAGFVVGYIAIKLPFPTFIGWPLGIGSALAGIAFAFVPIQERPLDRWLAAFIKSVYSPTQFIWRKENNPPAILLAQTRRRAQPAARLTTKHANNYDESRKKLKAYLAKLPKNPQETVDTEEAKKLADTLSLFTTASPVMAKRVKPPPSPPQPPKETVPLAPVITVRKEEKEKKEEKPPPIIVERPTHLVETPRLVKREVKLEEEKPGLKEEKPREEKKVEIITNQTKGLTAQIGLLTKQLEESQVSQERYRQLEQQMAQLLAEKDRLTKKLAELRQKISEKKRVEVVRPTLFKEKKREEETVKIIKPKVAKEAGFPSIPQVPNIISGIIKDARGTLLPNILVTIRDSDGIPVRALKTNKLGQFAASTPLPKGTYTLEFEDRQKRYHFAIIEITLTDDLVTPLEILAKGEKELHREKLIREVFGNTI